jgi:hypothetical protein
MLSEEGCVRWEAVLLNISRKQSSGWKKPGKVQGAPFSTNTVLGLKAQVRNLQLQQKEFVKI